MLMVLMDLMEVLVVEVVVILVIQEQQVVLETLQVHPHLKVIMAVILQ